MRELSRTQWKGGENFILYKRRLSSRLGFREIMPVNVIFNLVKSSIILAKIRDCRECVNVRLQL